MRARALHRVGSGLAVGGLALTLLSGVLAVAASADAGDGLGDPRATDAATTLATDDPTTEPTTDPTTAPTTEPTAPAGDPGPTASPTDGPTPTPDPTPTPVLPSDFPTTSSTQTQAWVDPQLVAGHDATDPGYGALRGLTVTVNQTKDITNQGVTIAWSGAPATSHGRFAANYLQVMQCWGDPATGPTAEQCQWGAPPSGLSGLLGDRVGGRTLRPGEDPQQAYDAAHLVPPPLTNPNLKAYAVPFRAVDGTTVWDTSPYFTSATTNEITATRTGDDGTGTAVFTTNTTLEAPQLGCGDRLANGTGRSCWLVVVPRTAVDADGTPVEQTPDGALSGSPLSATAWRDRLVFRLDFQPVGSSCRIGADERRVVGHELVSDAITSWQPALCATGTTYGFSQIGDDEARGEITSDQLGAAHLGFVQRPLDATAGKEAGVVYAPVVQSAIVVAYNIETNDALGTKGAAANGTPVTDLTLNARLLAKLLTQSYRADVPGGGGKALTKNPRSIVTDPEFVELNPSFADFVPTAGPDGLLVALGSSDAAAQVWSWIKADPFAAAFLRGEPDEYGMVLNPAYRALDIAHDAEIDSYPKADLSTYRQDETVPDPGYGTLDLRPYMNDMNEGAMRAQRADAGGKVVWDVTKLPPGFTSSGAQLPGQRFELALTDASAAARFGLRTAALVNNAGQAVAPSAASIGAAVAAMPQSSSAPGVRVPDANARVLGAYPLATVSYVAIAVCRADADELKDDAGLLRVAAGTGQVPGDAQGRLPRGYVPLSAADAARTRSVAASLTSRATHTTLCGADPTTAPTGGTGTGGSGDGDGDGSPAGGSLGSGGGGALPPADADTGSGSGGGSGAPPAAAAPEVDPRVTPAAVTAMRAGLAGSLALGLPACVAGPLLMRRARLLEARGL
ncbi:hypothetical protein [Cellulomonas alba]|uniref:PBP domain-containing protein n=1 Tax=Cellulomonas alba TaxID=3053467 RepID=A0ABT7SH48_9CELL|nr:hypothetical protein [Cellulomonas alba]MDM7855520.1 hypothetical protein [Cellulomonas alba]